MITIIAELELACKNSNNPDSVFNYAQQDRFRKLKEVDCDPGKEANYIRLNVGTYGLPEALSQLAQSFSLIRGVSGEDLSGLNIERLPKLSYRERLERNLSLY